jgi:hypothetical protein
MAFPRARENGQSQFLPYAVALSFLQMINENRIPGRCYRTEMLEVGEDGPRDGLRAAPAVGDENLLPMHQAHADRGPDRLWAEGASIRSKPGRPHHRTLRRQGVLKPDSLRIDGTAVREVERSRLRVGIVPLLQIQQILPPIDVAVEQVFRASERAAG